MKWITINTNIDLETGEVIPAGNLHEYYTVKKCKPVYKKDETGKYMYREYTNECRKKLKQIEIQWTM